MTTQPFNTDDPNNPENYTFTGQDETGVHEKDVDVNATSKHHTLGKGPLQAAKGDHKHQMKDLQDYEAPAGVADHDLLENLGNVAAHGQYSLTTHTHSTVTDHGQLTGLTDADHTIASVQNLQETLNAKAPVHSHPYAPVHSHPYAASSHGNHPHTWATSVVTASSAGNATVYGGSAIAVPVICNGDSGAQSGRAPTIYNWWGNGFTSQNWNPGACRVNWIGC